MQNVSLSRQRKKHETLKVVRRKAEEEAAKRLAIKSKLDYINLSLYPLNPDDVFKINEKEAREAEIIIFKHEGKRLSVAVVRPDSPLAQKLADGLRKDGFDINFYIISASSLAHALHLYETYTPPPPPLIGELRIKREALDTFQSQIKDFQTLAERLKRVSTSQIIETIIAGAIMTEAGDIHIEPEKKHVRIRYRVDGVLHDAAHLSQTIYRDLLSRIKLVSGLVLNIHDRSQDGRFTIKFIEKGGELKVFSEVRVSVIPQRDTETVVMRVLGVGVKKLSIDGLGLREEMKQTLLNAINLPHGIVLTTGPTGSGKTTTLYAFLKHLNTPERKIITVEDPVEYKLSGITQTQVGKRYGFLNALRAILRQNPNIIMIGEIRDNETASIAVNSALTGHLVFSTLHTNDAAAIIPRLLELGVKPHLIPDVLTAAIAQRLVRRLCEHCKEQYEASSEEREAIDHALSVISPRARVDIPKEVPKLWRSRGCDKCFGLGYRGRAGVFEVITLTDRVRELIAKQATAHEILIAAIDGGMLTMLQDGIFKVFEGITNFAEVKRVTGQLPILEEIYESGATQMLMRGVRITSKAEAALQKVSSGKESLEALLAHTPLESILPIVVGHALRMRATDIHFEAERDAFVIRLRVDGVLHIAAKMHKLFHQSILSSLKILGGLETQRHKGVQEGRFSLYVGTQSLDARLSVLPGGYGETAVVRILRLSPEIQNLRLEDLGIRSDLLPNLEKALKQPTGLILSTGPTSSGKTTTMYALLRRLNVQGVKIITVEDPIEYRLSGIIQTQVREKEGYTFATALSALLRQNPNILMIGEIRDSETARIAVQASNTGHLVLSTVHANSATQVFERFTGLGADVRGLVSALRLVIGQRMLRRVCAKCAGKEKASGPVAAEIRRALAKLPPSVRRTYPSPANPLPTARACKECPFGYRGLVGAFEMLFSDRELEQLVMKKVPPAEVQRFAESRGMITIREDALLKTLQRTTTLEEVNRISGT